MGDLVLKGATSGQITLTPTAIAGTNTLTLPAKTGNIITSADSGTVTQGMIATGVANTGPAFSAYASASQTVTLATVTKVNIDTVDFETVAGSFDTTNKRFTPNVAGYYQINGVLRGTAATTFTALSLYFYKNGSAYRLMTHFQGTMTAGSNNHTSGSIVLYLNGSTDYVELWGQVNGSGTAQFSYSSTAVCSMMSGALVRAA